MTIVFLDSNIYRQLGQKFLENQDFKRLKDFLDSTYNDFGVLNVVQKEILDFYKKDIYNKLLQDYSRLKSQIEKNSLIQIEKLQDIEKEIDEGYKLAEKQFDVHKLRIGAESYSSAELLEFLLLNKRVNVRKDNTRDLLIAKDLIDFANGNKESQIILISDDDFFTTHIHVQEKIKKKKIENLHFFKSISDFLKEFGPIFDFVNEELVLKSIKIDLIKDELLKDIKCFPGYVSGFYSDKEYEDIPEIETLEIKDLEIHDYYVIKNISRDTYTIQISLAVPIVATYEQETKIEELEKFRKNPVYKYRDNYPESFDNQNRIIFDHKVLFLFEGVVNTKSETIENINFIDFFPDHFIWQEEMKKIKEQRKSIPTSQLCIDGNEHIFDENMGFYHISKFGPGLSWHYRCKKCGMIYDSGDFLD